MNLRNSKPENRYDNMLSIPRPVQSKPMPIANRAAQFSPFAALTGYEEKLHEKSRITDKKIELTDEEKLILNQKLAFLNNKVNELPYIDILYFQPDKNDSSDSKKTSGKYISFSGNLKKIKQFEKTILFTDSKEIEIEQIMSIEGSIFDYMEYES